MAEGADKKVVIVAGPNGAGKTTFAVEFLPNEADCPIFVNADLIAAGLSPFHVERVAIRAARLMLEEIHGHVRQGHSFAFETTLSGRGYARWIPRWQEQGYQVKVFFLKLDTVEVAVQRVAQRVLEGGHDVPQSVIRRRLSAGWRNFKQVYQGLADEWALYDNSSERPKRLEEDSRMNSKDRNATSGERDPDFVGADAAMRRAARRARQRARAHGGASDNG